MENFEKEAFQITALFHNFGPQGGLQIVPVAMHLLMMMITETVIQYTFKLFLPVELQY